MKVCDAHGTDHPDKGMKRPGIGCVAILKDKKDTTELMDTVKKGPNHAVTQ